MGMRIRITGKRILLGVGMSALFILICVGNVASGKWETAPAVLFAVAGVCIGFAAAFAVAPVPRAMDSQSGGRPFRSQLLLFMGAAIVFLVLLKVLNALHVDWRQWMR
jgi:hypothetical protein